MEQVGQALFGRRWRAELGESFDPPESMRFINRCMAEPPTGVIRETHRQQMLALIDARLGRLEALRTRIENAPPFRQNGE
jgi:hypothetical protein